MAVRVAVVGRMAAVVICQQHHEVRHQVGQRMEAIGHQALRVGHQADEDLCNGQADIDRDTDPRDSLRLVVAAGIGIRFGQLEGHGMRPGFSL